MCTSVVINRKKTIVGFNLDILNMEHRVSQTVCPTVVSMVFDVSDNVVYWCENRQWEDIKKILKFPKKYNIKT